MRTDKYYGKKNGTIHAIRCINKLTPINNYLLIAMFDIYIYILDDSIAPYEGWNPLLYQIFSFENKKKKKKIEIQFLI